MGQFFADQVYRQLDKLVKCSVISQGEVLELDGRSARVRIVPGLEVEVVGPPEQMKNLQVGDNANFIGNFGFSPLGWVDGRQEPVFVVMEINHN